MKLPKIIETAINAQVNLELQSSYEYLAMAAWFETTPYKGFASWMHKQSREENDHAMRFFNYLLSRGNTPDFAALKTPKKKYKDALDAFKTSLKHEQKVTSSIHKLYELAEKNKDYETKHFLSWFLQEQVEEEQSAQDMIEKLELVNNSPNGLLRLDSEAARRE